MVDQSATKASQLREVGLPWQSSVLGIAPLGCVVSVLLVYLLVPIGNHSPWSVVRGIGRLQTLARYLIFMAVLCSVVPLLSLVLFLPVQSITVPDEAAF